LGVAPDICSMVVAMFSLDYAKRLCKPQPYQRPSRPFWQDPRMHARFPIENRVSILSIVQFGANGLQKHLRRGLQRELPETARQELTTLLNAAPDNLRSIAPAPADWLDGELRGGGSFRAADRDDCVFIRGQGGRRRQAVVKRQFNPPKDLDLDRGQWQKAQLIVGRYSR